MNYVREQYEKWVYPFPAQDLIEDFNEGYFDLSDPSMFRRKLWPRPVEPAKLKILVAGCGTMQAARLAYRNPDCDILGIDISQSSLDHESYLKNKHGLTNLRLQCLGIPDIETLREQFDLIVSTGVLHHMPDPDLGLRKLKAVLLPHGVMSIMVYGWYRRFGVYMLQEAFRLLGVEQTPEGVAVVRETLAALPAWHHVQSFARSSPDVKFDAGLVDIFLHRCDRAYTVTQVLQLASDNGLIFQDWLDRHGYSLTGQIADSLSIYPLAARLQPEQQWQLAEILSQSLGCHSFLLCHPERNREEYAVDFVSSKENWLDYVPHLRPPLDVQPAQEIWVPYVRRPSALPAGAPATLRRHTHVFILSAQEVPLFQLVDGKASIARIIQACSTNAQELEENRRIALHLFGRMREWDHLMFQI